MVQAFLFSILVDLLLVLLLLLLVHKVKVVDLRNRVHQVLYLVITLLNIQRNFRWSILVLLLSNHA